MTDDELVTVARTHTVDFPKLSGEPWANQERLNKVTVLETVIVSFESEQHPRKIMILLERESGKFIASCLTAVAQIPNRSKRLTMERNSASDRRQRIPRVPSTCISRL